LYSFFQPEMKHMKTILRTIGITFMVFLSGTVMAQNPTRVANISTRVRSGPGSSTAIIGFNVSPGQNKTILARAVGPGLAPFGISTSGAMNDPILTLFSGGREMFQNDNWETQNGYGGSTYRVAILAVGNLTGAFPLSAGGKDAAILTDVAPGNYTVQTTAKDLNVGNAYGVILFEVYDVTDPVNRQSGALKNLSSRGYVGTGSDVMIMGIVIDGQTPLRVLVRAIGPSLAAFGVSSILNDPVITVKNSKGETIGGNDDWNNNCLLYTSPSPRDH
jgi:hypothetical protein